MRPWHTALLGVSVVCWSTAGHAQDAPPATLRLESDRSDLTVHLQTRSVAYEGAWGHRAQSREYVRTCTAPCNALLSPGTHRFAVSLPSSTRLVEGSDDVRVANGDTVRAHYDSKSSIRLAGAIVLPVSAAAGIGLVVGALLTRKKLECTGDTCEVNPPPNMAVLGSGLALIAVGGVVGLLLMGAEDSVRFEVIPSSRTGVVKRVEGKVSSQGLSLKVTF
jgi:hypothetical protein